MRMANRYNRFVLGTDLLYLPPGVDAVGINLSESMLARARRKLPVPDCAIDLRVGDAQAGTPAWHPHHGPAPGPRARRRPE